MYTIKAKRDEYRIPNNPTKKHFKEIVNFIWEYNVDQNLTDDIVEFCKSKNPRFNEELFYQAISTYHHIRYYCL